MVALVEGEVQALGDGGEHLLRGLGATLALEPRVVVGRHVAQGRDLLAPQTVGTPTLPAGSPTSSGCNDSRRRRRKPASPVRSITGLLSRSVGACDLPTSPGRAPPRIADPPFGVRAMGGSEVLPRGGRLGDGGGASTRPSPPPGAPCPANDRHHRPRPHRQASRPHRWQRRHRARHRPTARSRRCRSRPAGPQPRQGRGGRRPDPPAAPGAAVTLQTLDLGRWSRSPTSLRRCSTRAGRSTSSSTTRA